MLKEQLHLARNSARTTLNITYKELASSGINIGFSSVMKNGRDFHQITRDLVISYMHFHDGKLTNMVFSEGQPIRLDLCDQELISYFSDYIELRYIIEGTLQVEIEGNEASFREGEICFIDSQAYHKEKIAESNCLLLNVNIDRSVFTDAFLNGVGLSPLQSFLRANILKQSHQRHFIRFTPQNTGTDLAVERCLSIIVNETRAGKPGYLDIAKGFFLRLMDHLTQSYHFHFDESESLERNRMLFDSVTAYIDSHLSTITLQELSDQFHYHPNYFSPLIKKYTGLSYSAYIIQERIERAKTLLATTRITIDEVMWLIGYNNKGFFYKQFKKSTGTSPADYRKKVHLQK